MSSQKYPRPPLPVLSPPAVSPRSPAPLPESLDNIHETGPDPGQGFDELLGSLEPIEPERDQPFVDTIASEGQGTSDDLATHLRQESPEMVQSNNLLENNRTFEHPLTDRPSAPLSSLPVADVPAGETAEAGPSPQLDLPRLPPDRARQFAAGVKSAAARHDAFNQEGQRRADALELSELEPLAVEWLNTLERLASASGVGRNALQEMFTSLAKHASNCGFDGSLPTAILTLEQVLSLLGAARNLSRNVPDVSGFDVERLALTFAQWLRTPANPSAPRPGPPRPEPVEAPRSHKAAPKPPATKSGAGRPALPADEKTRREREKQQAAERKVAEQQEKANQKARAARMKELEREMATLAKGKGKTAPNV